MPFPMTHLIIAYNIVQRTNRIQNPADFLLGAVTPDAIHFRHPYQRHLKKTTHLDPSDQPWGQITENEAWTQSVMDFIAEHEDVPHLDFIYGYAAHVLMDIHNNQQFWTPFRLQHAGQVEDVANPIYYRESTAVDRTLYQSFPQRDAIWQLLAQGVVRDVPGRVTADEVAAIQSHILNHQYIEIQSADMTDYQYITMAQMQRFIHDVSASVEQSLFGLADISHLSEHDR